jgi:hypothetical protein
MLRLLFYSSDLVFLFVQINEVMKDVQRSIFGFGEIREELLKQLVSITLVVAFERKDASMPDRLECLALNALALYLKLLITVRGGCLGVTE